MRFELEATCTFSKEIGKAKKDIEEVLARAAQLLVKGAPAGKEAEASRVKSWSIKGKDLKLLLESGRYVRAHETLFRLTKVLSTELGKKHKIGLRGIRAPRYTVSISSPGLSKEEVSKNLGNLPCEVEVTPELLVLTLRDLDESSLRGHVVDRLISILESAQKAPPGPRLEAKVVMSGKPIKHPFKEDPFEVAKKLGWISEFPGRGQWVYAAPYTKLLRVIEDIIIEQVALPLGFREVMFPKLIPLEVMQLMPGYLDELPEGMYFVCPPPRNPEVFEKFKRELKLTRQINREELKRCLKEPSYVLAPAQCEPFYEYMNNYRFRVEDLPVKLFDRSGWTYRWEGGGVEGLVRTQEFRRIEFVSLGTPSDAVSIRDAVRDRSIEVTEKLGLQWRVLVATPFYMRDGGIEADTGDSSKVATYDLETKLPYNDEWLELTSFNVHRSKFVETFKIKEVKGKEIWTGCCGFGTTRWVAAFLAQHGFDPAGWPEEVKKRVGTLPENPKGVE